MILIRPLTIPPSLTTATGAILTSSNVSENDYSAYNAGTSYDTGDRVIVLDGYHRVYESLEDSNVGNYPPTNLTKWLDISATNRWKLFDGSVDNLTVNSGSIEIELTPDTLVNAIAFFNLSASTVQIIIDSSLEGEVYNEEFDLSNNDGVHDWYDYFYEPTIKTSDLFITGLPAYGDATITITIDNGSDDAYCGQICIGNSINLGNTLFNSTLSINDYSIKSTDDYGNTTLIPRKYVKSNTFRIYLENITPEYLLRVLADYRAKPAAWAADLNYESTYVFGYYTYLKISLTDKDISFCDLELEGI